MRRAKSRAKRAASTPAYFNRGYRPFYSSTDTNSNLYIPEDQCHPAITLQESDSNAYCQLPTIDEAAEDERRVSRASVLSSLVMLTPIRKWPAWRFLRPSNIDKYSRWSFPTIFVLFNVGYWSYFLRISHHDAVLNTDF
ncbi:Neurotransmitter-gated ion-channel transmembrane region, variant 2 [Parelaphostrongylus tenuis]|uniref:Neurotransmitter-gated ion-channel transmembrane region, variant 2 n=1 Tax=Parelaphostrongylus tenuis TaxID=148309 RepID=A0AAD5RA38_PARTN|nr:Neurotransmitter-gated ion-channel transmembrane region, variant 2 [Parelaphostrongylus tenuis]